MPKELSIGQLEIYRTRINTGGLSEAIKVYGELYAHGYRYAGWGRGVATGRTVTGVSALDFLSSTALLGLGSQEVCKNLTPAQIDKIRVSMAKGYVGALIGIASKPGAAGVVGRDVDFKETQEFHAQGFKDNNLSIDNWTLHTPMALIRKTQGDAAVEKIWQSLRDTGGDGADSLIASTSLSTRIGQLAFSSDPAVARAAQNWMDQTPGFANIQQIGRALTAVIASVSDRTTTAPANPDAGNAIMSSVTSLSIRPAAHGGATATATIKTANSAPSIYTITTRPVTTGAMAGRSIVTTTNTQTGQASYQLQSADGGISQGNVAANGNVSFMADSAIYVYQGSAYVGSFDPAGGSGTLANGESGRYRYDPTTGLFSHTAHTIGRTHIGGFSATQTSGNGLAWSTPVYTFDHTHAAMAADYAAWAGLGNGSIDRNYFQNLVNASTDFLVRNNSVFTPTPSYTMPGLIPIGAFYESRSAGLDTAASIAHRSTMT